MAAKNGGTCGYIADHCDNGICPYIKDNQTT